MLTASGVCASLALEGTEDIAPQALPKVWWSLAAQRGVLRPVAVTLPGRVLAMQTDLLSQDLLLNKTPGCLVCTRDLKRILSRSCLGDPDNGPAAGAQARGHRSSKRRVGKA